ncbi:MAG TPA: Hsp20/alpha crystallin family protein [Gemmatimonadaceae bacterium]|jgi:HSP20 family protein|nr:Hsp20/alpha crystallin family protein [Gemmatimonadaceae bacterium]
MNIYRTRWAAQRELLLGGWAPVVDVNESASDVGITVELPGLDPSAVEITYENDVLTVKGEKKSTRKEGDTETRYHIVERTFGEFTRSFRMPKGLDESKIDAQYANGVLTIRVPKAAVAAPRKIEIKTAA